jgi:6-phosphogluconate dehydrogenase
MQLGMIGLGKMGSNMVRRLMANGHDCAVYDRNPEPGKELAKIKARPAQSLKELVQSLERPRHIWVMVPAGKPTEESIEELAGLLEEGDCVIDGGNSITKTMYVARKC